MKPLAMKPATIKTPESFKRYFNPIVTGHPGSKRPTAAHYVYGQRRRTNAGRMASRPMRKPVAMERRIRKPREKKR